MYQKIKESLLTMIFLGTLSPVSIICMYQRYMIHGAILLTIFAIAISITFYDYKEKEKMYKKYLRKKMLAEQDLHRRSGKKKGAK